jgi:PAS domain-containing protein
MTEVAQTWSYVASSRERAVARLSGGSQLDLSRASTSEAMAVLFKLASSPDTASDARALLHELQVHQVEVEMQHEELLQSRVLLEGDLIRQTTRALRAPAALLVVDGDTVISDVNPAGARLLGVASDVLPGRSLASFLSVAGADKLHMLLAQVREGAMPETCALELLPQEGLARTLLCSASEDMNQGMFLLALMAPVSPG